MDVLDQLERALGAERQAAMQQAIADEPKAPGFLAWGESLRHAPVDVFEASPAAIGALASTAAADWGRAAMLNLTPAVIAGEYGDGAGRLRLAAALPALLQALGTGCGLRAACDYAGGASYNQVRRLIDLARTAPESLTPEDAWMGRALLAAIGAERVERYRAMGPAQRTAAIERRKREKARRKERRLELQAAAGCDCPRPAPGLADYAVSGACANGMAGAER